MTHRRSLPPPIIDKTSGKTFIAIPASDFVLPRTDHTTGDKNAKREKPNFVYIQASPPHVTNGSGPLTSRQTTEKTRRSVQVGTWMRNSITTEPPPGHVPWSGASVEADSVDELPNALAQTICRTPVSSQSSASTLEIPLCECDTRTLVHESLPSADSRRWVDSSSTPHIREALKVIQHDPIAEAHKKNSQGSSDNARRKRCRQTLCVTDVMVGRREASIFKPRITDQYRGTNNQRSESLGREKALSTLGDMDNSVTLALGRIDSAIVQLQKEKDKLDRGSKLPALVVSTPQITKCIFVEDAVKSCHPESRIAKRRGKDSPGVLHLPTRLERKSEEYPDVPTPYQCVSTPTQVFTEVAAPVYPELILDKKMSAEQMINSLRYQVANFVPHSPLATNVGDAEAWLKDEIIEGPLVDEAKPVAAFPSVPISPLQETETSVEIQKSCSRSLLAYANSEDASLCGKAALPTATLPLASNLEPDEFLSSDLTFDQSTPRTARFNHSIPSRSGKPQRPILILNGSSSPTPSVRKRVRFSSVEAQTIDLPLLSIFKPPSIPLPDLPTIQARDPVSSPPRRKPIPLKLASTTASQSPKPLSYISGLKRLDLDTKPRKPSPLNPHIPANNEVPKVVENSKAKAAQVVETSIIQRRFSTISGPPSNSKEIKPTPSIARDKKFGVVQPTSLPRGPLIFSTMPNARDGSEKLRKSLDINSQRGYAGKDTQRRQSQALGGKENQAPRFLSLSGLSLARMRSFTTPADNRFSGVVINDRSTISETSKIGKGKDAQDGRKTMRQSMPFQSMLNRLRG